MEHIHIKDITLYLFLWNVMIVNDRYFINKTTEKAEIGNINVLIWFIAILMWFCVVQCFASSYIFIDFTIKSGKTNHLHWLHNTHTPCHCATGIDRQCEHACFAEKDKHKHHTPPPLKLAGKEATFFPGTSRHRRHTSFAGMHCFTLSLKPHSEFS